ncbi:uncharacterized protein Nmag_2870 [Natrialba magadii ATCC 43099]|uniref:Uncharacterized protein n=1 Tax=Natrialba magadii (strain ATCC 43099 / DSM 3394 / CCM 3739 / CIP 104546 / IAM 13178 / JCM 8861 / NBRC 102185 / NCIMB 2190 / MS3) TaxID=547559 RepID=D3T0E4_NATMM|nr:hypothetical protein [Natrialba magadii]ADD06423.1 uncharacterized protein Nmag_2870 [Natrialba magadii ATCC 43099]ELY31690.1 hypothetical protein C500_06050 [Natrialba magadii ATCC 43099]
MRLDRNQRFHAATRGIESVQSGALLFGFSLLLSFFMGTVIFMNGG